MRSFRFGTKLVRSYGIGKGQNELHEDSIVSDLDVPTDYELHAMETQLQIEEMRDELRQHLGEFREEIRYLKRIVAVMGAVGVAVMSLIGVHVCVECAGWGFWGGLV
ncbi:unnamed protein product [Lactuca virosa]|uniref:t-SNARE coiled-coil homology domain-containing protein n=1 Tax=Lactuca virosa TaxID=75947 RepID=A0AAU9N0R4_9ASTR|nr:unnamed protein product [Lactuca virosa]